jgi:protein involved in polysaccharide export with SLBB domain
LHSIRSWWRSRLHRIRPALWAGLSLVGCLICAAPAWGVNPDTVFVLRQTAEEPEEPVEVKQFNFKALDRSIDPASYLVGPGDRLSVNIWGAIHKGFDVPITPEATAIVPTVGEIPLLGLTLDRAKQVILTAIGRVYPGVPSSVTLVQVRTLKVAVAGAVKNPGMYEVTANVHASEAIDAAGWLPSSSRRRIYILRGNDTLQVDEQRFNQTGNEAFNPYLTEGDHIVVPEARVAHGVFEISGTLNRPGVFEFVPGDRLQEAIELAYGFTIEADTTSLELVRFVGLDSTVVERVIDLSAPAPQGGRELALQADDRIFVRSQLEYRPKATVTVLGEVARPGRYPIQSGQTLLSELFVMCGGLTSRADLAGATLSRSRGFLLDTDTDERMRSIPVELQTDSEREWILAHSLSPAGQVSIDLVRLLETQDVAYDLPLWDEDYVYVPRFLPQIKVIGRVTNPGLIPYEPNRGPDYYLERAGGYSWRADRRGTFVVKANTGSPLKKKKVKQLEAGDVIVVPTVRERQFWPILRDAMVVLGNVATLYLVVDQSIK